MARKARVFFAALALLIAPALPAFPHAAAADGRAFHASAYFERGYTVYGTAA